MKGKKRLLYVTCLVFVMLMCMPTTAYAYFDPGTGSMLLQILGIAFITLSGFFVAFKNRIRNFFNKRKNKASGNENDDLNEEPDEDVGNTSGDKDGEDTPEKRN